MVRFFFVGLGELLTLAATALAVLVNMGQLTQNIVARNIYLASMSTAGLGNSISAAGAGSSSSSLYAPNQAAAALQGQGIKNEYYWGMYTLCAGAGVSGNRDCSDRYIGYRWQPVQALEQDAPPTYTSQIQTIVGNGTVSDDHYLGLLSRVANIIILAGTILTGLAFLTGFLAHRFCFAFAALEALGAAGCLGVGAALWTAILYKAKNSVPDNIGIVIHYGNALWMTWGAFAAITLSIIPLILACCLGRSKY
ncbi:unnamed protein product [Parajaminaea phylloscopi]